jgi:hypothetical protein
MRANTQCTLPFLHGERIVFQSSQVATACRPACRRWLGFGITLAIALSLTGLICAADGTASSTDNADTRWLPWIGSWRLISDTVNENDRSAKEDYLLDISLGDDGKSIVMKSSQDEATLLEEKIVVDGSRQPLKNNGCTGWYKYSWSDTGKRLLFESESGCPGGQPRFISGISIITDNRYWLDIQHLRSGEERAISVRKYEAITNDLSTPEKTGPRAIGMARFPAASSLSIDEIVELSHKVAPEVIEVALVEIHKPFKINSDTLVRLADAGVPPQVVDLMVALSFPDKFTVERHAITPVRQYDSERPGTAIGPPYVWLPFGYWSIYGPFSDWYWSSSIYSLYGYWGWGWDVWTRGHPSGRNGRNGGYSGGRLINGRGYSRVAPSYRGSPPRRAQPRSDSGYSNGGNQNNASFSPPPASSIGNGSGSSSGNSGNAGGGSAGASRGGYHSGDSRSGKAKPRE